LSAKTVLVLEDDESSRFVLREILEHDGFAVLSSAGVNDAVEVCQTHPEPIAILVCDVVLRGPGGPEGIRQLKQLRPDMSILFISGYPLEQLENRGMVEKVDRPGERTDFLQKPFSAKALLKTVHSLIDRAEA
jgi:CheY-like chemotaxis protein